MNATNNHSSLLPNGHLSRFFIARAIAADLEPKEIEVMEQHAQTCSDCGKLWHHAQVESRQFSAAFPTWDELRKTVGAREKGSDTSRERAWLPTGNSLPGRIWEWWQRVITGPKVVWGMAFVALGLGTMIYYLGSQPGSIKPVGPESEWTPKGLVDKSDDRVSGTAYYAFVNGKSATGDSLRVKAGDTLQFGIVSPAPVYYAMYYRDDGGDLKPYFTAGDASLTPIGSATGENLPKSLVLDSLWKRETLYALASSKPFSHDEALARIRAEEAGRLPQDGPTLKQFLLISGQP